MGSSSAWPDSGSITPMSRIPMPNVSGEQIASKQRQRWNTGVSSYRAKTLTAAEPHFRKRSAVCLDLALDLLVLPLSYVTLNVMASCSSPPSGAFWRPDLQGWLWLSAACAASLALYVLRGCS